MLKKAMVIGGALVLLLTLFNTPTIKSFVSTALDRGKEVVADAESIENKIRRAESMIKDLTKPIANSMHQIAKEEVAVEKLRTQLATSEERLAKADKDINRLASDLRRGDSHYVYVGKTYSKTHVEKDLKRRFDRFKRQKDTADKLGQILDARERGLDAAKANLSELQGAKSQLEVDVADLRASLHLLQVAQTSSHLTETDNSELTAARSLMEDIRTRIDVANKMLDSQEEYNSIELDEPESEDVLEEVTRYFGENEPEVNEIALD